MQFLRWLWLKNFTGADSPPQPNRGRRLFFRQTESGVELRSKGADGQEMVHGGGAGAEIEGIEDVPGLAAALQWNALGTVTVSGASDITLDEVFDVDLYQRYWIEFDLLPATDGANLLCDVRNALPANVGATLVTSANAGNWGNNPFAFGGSPAVWSSIGNQVGEGVSGRIEFVMRPGYNHVGFVRLRAFSTSGLDGWADMAMRLADTTRGKVFV